MLKTWFHSHWYQLCLPQLSDIVTECLNTWKWQAQSSYLRRLGSRVCVSTLWPSFCVIQSMDRIKSPLQTDRKSVCLNMFSCIYFNVTILVYLVWPHLKWKKNKNPGLKCNLYHSIASLSWKSPKIDLASQSQAKNRIDHRLWDSLVSTTKTTFIGNVCFHMNLLSTVFHVDYSVSPDSSQLAE